MEQEDRVINLIRLVLGVARLGDADLFGWWQSRSFTDAARYVLGGAFPRTWQVSALEATVLSAAVRHAEVLTRPTAVHLFSSRLPVLRLALDWLRERKVAGEADGLIAELRGWTCLSGPRALAEWATTGPPQGEILGSEWRVGLLRSADLERPESVERAVRTLAACYANQTGDLRFPCFELILR